MGLDTSDGDTAAADPSLDDQLVVAADLHLLADVRAWVRRRAMLGSFSERDLGDIDLAVTEAVSNVIRHAYGGDSRREVSIRAALEDSQLVISIIDSGLPFLGTAPSPDLDSAQEGGYGVHLISAVMDNASWTRLPDGRNQLRLVRTPAP